MTCLSSYRPDLGGFHDLSGPFFTVSGSDFSKRSDPAKNKFISKNSSLWKKTYFKFLCESCSIFVTEKIRLQFNVAIISNLQGRRILSFSGSGQKIQIRQKRSGSIQKGPDPTGPQQSGRHCLKVDICIYFFISPYLSGSLLLPEQCPLRYLMGRARSCRVLLDSGNLVKYCNSQVTNMHSTKLTKFVLKWLLKLWRKCSQNQLLIPPNNNGI